MRPRDSAMLVRGVDYIGMPNLLAGRAIVPELIQGDVTAAQLVSAREKERIAEEAEPIPRRRQTDNPRPHLPNRPAWRRPL